MSFITKRERVFNEYDLYDLPARNEGKLKAYASCTDARAWSHFHSDKTEHLVEIIKRNNDKCAPKYVPTTVIVDTLMVTKNAEIGRLRRKIESLEQMLAVYDDINLDCNQKCEIAKAHEAIKAANKELDEMCLDLDLSGFTEGLDSDAYETGKSRGDETSQSRLKEIGYERRQSTPRVDSKAIQLSLEDQCTCEAGTNATDPRIDEMQDDIINKDAKLSAMQNTIAVMENDVCEPYCVYAHIYTALEKIFGILNQNDKYREYLDLLTAGKDTRCIDIKGKILFKMKVLEKFCIALIAPCSQEFTTSQSATDCSCYHAAIVARVETTFALTTAEARQPLSLENKRAKLVAEIMDNDEMKEILSKECFATDGEQTDEELAVEYYNIDSENLNRLKDLQKSYDELMVCYENLKHERECLQLRCSKNNQLEMELENLQCQIRSYSTLWNEKEHYRKRSEDLDTLKEKFVVLCDEATQLETQLKTENEKNYNKTITIDELRREILQLEKKLNEVTISFEREKNALLCKLKETECKCMCQDQQIKQLTEHLDQQLEKKQEKDIEESEITIGLMNEIGTLKDQIKNLKDLLCCSEEEKLNLQEQFEDNLQFINGLKMEVEDWRSSYEKMLNRNNYLEKYVEGINNLEEENKALHLSAEEKDKAIKNLMDVISDKSLEMNILLDEIERKRQENKDLLNELQSVKATTHSQIGEVESDKQEVLHQLQRNLIEEELKNQELTNKMKDYDTLQNRENEIAQALQTKTQDYEGLKELLSKLTEGNNELKAENEKLEYNNNLLLQEIDMLRSENNSLKHELKNTETEASSHYEALQNKSENLSQELNILKHAFSELVEEKNRLECALDNKAAELDDAMTSIQLTRNQSEELLGQIEDSNKIIREYNELSEAYKKLVKEKYILKNNLTDKNKNIENLITELNILRQDNSNLVKTAKELTALQQKIERIKAAYNEMEDKNGCLENEIQERSIQMDAILEKLQNKDDEQTELLMKLQDLSNENSTLDHSIAKLKEENMEAHQEIQFLREKGTEYCDKLKYFEHLADDFEKLKRDYEHKHFHMKEEIKALTAEMQNMYEQNQALEEKLSEETKRPEYDYDYIQHEVQKFKQEKMASHNKIKELLDEQDKNENTISNLRQDLLARDDKIAILENQINLLGDEVQHLHSNLEQGINTGEDMIDKSIPQINASLKQIEAHHSKASHNMKVELAKLQKENALLEEKLSNNKSNNTDELLRDKHKYISQNIQLQNERDVIVSGIQQLEMISVGDSDLAPDHCEVDQVLLSIEKVRRSFVSRNSQNSALEQTLLKIQSSSQLVLSKADEAKKIAENEKQKITNEKEDAIKERLHLEEKLTELQNQLKKQIMNDEKVIKDLESEILNQKLIIDKINESTEKYVTKLQEEIDSLQDLYKTAQDKIQNLQIQMQNMNDTNNKNIEVIEKINELLEDKSNEVIELQAMAKNLKSQNESLLKLKVENTKTCFNKDTQTETEPSNKVIDSEITNSTSVSIKIDKEDNNMENIGEVKIRKRSENKTFHNMITPKNPANVNEVQILTANIEPTIDLVKNIYQNYKINKLGPGPLELNSIASNEEFENSYENPNYDVSQTKYFIEDVDSPTLIDIFSNNKTVHSFDSNKRNDDKNTPSKPKFMESSVFINKKPYKDDIVKQIDEQDDLQTIHAQTSNKIEESKVVTEFQSEEDGSENESHSKKSRDLISLAPAISEETAADQEVFMIFRDSDSSKSKRNHETLQIKDFKNTQPIDQTNKYNAKEKYIGGDVVNKKQDRVKTMKGKNVNGKPDGSAKVKLERNKTEIHINENLRSGNNKESLQINIPRVNFENQSIVSTNTDGKKKSVDLFAVVINPHPIPGHKTRSDADLAEKNITDKTRTPSLPSISNFNDQSYYQDSLNSMEFASEEDTIKKILRQQLSDTDDEKLKQKENALKSNKSSVKTEGETSAGTTENTFAHTSEESHHKLFRVPADVLLHKSADKSIASQPARKSYGLEYILDTVRREGNLQNLKTYRQNKTKDVDEDGHMIESAKHKTNYDSKLTVNPLETISKSSQTNLSDNRDTKILVDKSVLVNVDSTLYYENKIQSLTKTIDNIDKDYKKKLDSIKAQYDTNIKNIISEHNHGVKSMQNLHEEILQDIMRTHENEVENLRGMSMEAMRKADKLAKVNQNLLNKLGDSSEGLEKELLNLPEKEPVKITGSVEKRRRTRSKGTKTLSKTSVESFDVKPKARPAGPCSCTLDDNVSDTIRNIFDQVDVDQRKLAEFAYMKYIANKMLTGNVENLDAQELSFLHYKVCRSWKSKLSKEEALQKRIDALESELMNKQRNAQQHIAELDRKVTEERRRLQEVREQVCSNTPAVSREVSPSLPPARPNTAAEKDVGCTCNIGMGMTCSGRRSAGDLTAPPCQPGRFKRPKTENHRAVLAKPSEDRRGDRRLYCDEQPTRLRKTPDRSSLRGYKK